MANEAALTPQLLIVDDDEFAVKLLVSSLGLLGYKSIETAANGKIALQKLQQSDRSYEVIFLDLKMPEMDGVEFLSVAKVNNVTAGIILLSGEDERVLEFAGKLASSEKLNFLGSLTKPPSQSSLKDLMGEYPAPVESQRPFDSLEPITEQELRSGLIQGSDALCLVFQPKIHIQSGEIAGVETLARWQHPQRGLLAAGAFIPLAEEIGVIDELTNLIYRKAVLQTAQWLKAGIYLKTAINFSIESFLDAGFVDFITRVTAEAELNPRQLILEVSDTQLMSDSLPYLKSMMQLRMQNFEFSLDDFGLSESYTSQLENAPFTEFKIDGAVIHKASKDDEALPMLNECIKAGRQLKADIVAEGVETREDWDLAESLGFDYVQGYFCAKPMPNNELLEFMDTWRPPSSRIAS